MFSTSTRSLDLHQGGKCQHKYHKNLNQDRALKIVIIWIPLINFLIIL